MFIAPLFSQTNNQIEIKVYDGYAYFNSSKYVPIDNAKVLYNEVEKYTDTLGCTKFKQDTITNVSILVNAVGYENQVINCNNECCMKNGEFEIFLGNTGAYYGYSLEGKRMPFDLRENSFCFFVHDEKTKKEALAVVPDIYQNSITISSLDKSNQAFLILVDSVQISNLKANDLFDHLRRTGARVYLVSKDLETFVGTSFNVQPCSGSNALFQLRNEILKKYPELNIELNEIFTSTWTIHPPKNALLDVFDWVEKINDLNNIAQIRMDTWQFIYIDK